MFAGCIGKLCIAKSSDNTMFYRAAIRKINRDRTVELFYFDYGSFCVENIVDLKEMR